MTRKKRNTLIIAGVVVIAIVIGAVFILPRINLNSTVGADPSGTATQEAGKDFEQQEQENMQETLLVYADYGLTYDAETQKLYYDGQLVKKFVDEGLIQIEQADGTVNIKAIRNSDGTLTGLDVK